MYLGEVRPDSSGLFQKQSFTTQLLKYSLTQNEKKINKSAVEFYFRNKVKMETENVPVTQCYVTFII
jgi:hypothetical protein